MHFSRKQNTDNPPVRHGDHAKTAKPSLRWLGILLDRKLTFKDHVCHWTKKAGRVANHLRSLCNTVRGLPVQSTRRAVISCVLPVLTHGLEVWYPGTERTKESGSTASCRTKGLLQKMNSGLRTAMRAILPVWRTHPGHILHFEAQIPPAELLAESIRRRHGFRLGKVDKNHPLVGRIPLQARKEATRLQRCCQLVPNSQRPALVKPSFKKPPQRGDKEEEAHLFRQWLLERDEHSDLVIYSDGSQLKDHGLARTGWGFTIRKGGTTQEVYRNKGRLLQAEVVDAEAHGALQGLAAARAIGRQKCLFVCLDNTSVVDGLNGNPPESSQAVFLRFQQIAALHEPGVIVKWIPGHKDIEGNEAADKLAKEGAMLETGITTAPTIAWVKRDLRNRNRKDFREWWNAQGEPRYKGLDSFAVVKQSLVSFQRATLHRLLAARSGHGDFAVYHERFGHTDSNNHCSCGERKTPQHIFFCRRLRGHRLLPRNAPRVAYTQFLGEESRKWARFVEDSKFFTNICPR